MPILEIFAENDFPVSIVTLAESFFMGLILCRFFYCPESSLPALHRIPVLLINYRVRKLLSCTQYCNVILFNKFIGYDGMNRTHGIEKIVLQDFL